MSTTKQAGIVGLLLVAAVASRGQDKKPPDYASKPLEYWIEALKNGEKPVLRYQARRALGPDGPYAKVAVPALIDAFAHKEPPVGTDAVEALADFGPSVVPHLVRALKRPEAPVRTAVADALGYVEPKPVDAVPALLDAMKDSTPEVRSAAVSSLGSIRRPLEKTVPALASALRDDQDQVREAAAGALSSMGRESKPALPALIVALKDKNWRVRDSAAQALWKIGPDAKAAVPALIEGLRDKKNDHSRWTMAQALGGIGPEAKDAVPVLIEAMEDKDNSIRRWAAVALERIGPGAKAAVPALIAAAKDKNNSERDNAIAALGAIGPSAKAAVPMLMEALEKGESYLSFRCTVAEALGGIGPPAKEAVPALAAIARNQLDGEDIAYRPTRQAAAEAVMKIDPEYGAKHGIEFAYLDVRLGKIPCVKLAPRAALTEEKKKHIKKLIADLAELADPDFGLSSTLTGHAFAPLPDHEHFGMGLLTDHRLKSSDALRSLVEIGPEALPFLLKALGDKTPTKLKIERFGNTFLGSELSGNPLNSVERRVLSENKTRKDDDDDEAESRRVPNTLKVGDACFVAIGQTVGRPYSAVRYQPTAIVIVNSPVESKELRERVRAIWSSDDPAQKLLDSLLIDYATEGIFNGKSLDGWSEGSERQIEAAIRLLYYFPKESAPLIAERLKRMDVRRPKQDNDASMMRDVANGAYTTDFLKAMNWCKEPMIRKALFDIFERTNDVQVTLAVLPSVKESHAELIVPRLQAMLKKVPESEDDARGDGYELLLALGRNAGKEAKPEFERYLRDGSSQRRWTMCWVMEKVHPEWALEFLTPMLTDKRTGFGSEKLRLCDMAAMTLSEIHSDLRFQFDGSPEELDRQIEKMCKQIEKKGK
jgi:HEAT repeat protein